MKLNSLELLGLVAHLMTMWSASTKLGCLGKSTKVWHLQQQSSDGSMPHEFMELTSLYRLYCNSSSFGSLVPRLP